MDLPKEMEVQKLLQSALDGFLFIVSADGDVTYVSENIAEFLGLAQVGLIKFSRYFHFNNTTKCILDRLM